MPEVFEEDDDSVVLKTENNAEIYEESLIKESTKVESLTALSSDPCEKSKSLMLKSCVSTFK